MKIYDKNLENELESPNLTQGHLEPARRLVAHHEAVEREFHYEVMEGTVTDECPEGLRREVEDTPAREAWDEYEDVQRYVPYTEAELAEIAEKKAAEETEKAAKEAAEKKAAEEAQAAAEKVAKEAAEQAEKIARIDAIDAQVTYTAMMTDTLMSEEGA